MHGHTGLEIAWTAVPAVLVTAIAVVSAVVLAKNEHVPRAAAGSSDPLKPLVVDVTAQQFAWLFKYPAYDNATSSTLRLPVHATVQLRPARARRDPLVLGARVQPEGGRGPGAR